ncbi:hypothetical protein PHLCEN_2v11648 [Hermanssonia centrifuga]|uniref:Protein kinase domain-containing protein n=1 Tax=Hermanssonia centrifuga TaxID=98765 RepID=A0A2R6NJJ1_9APHY|nr:hypothetical protein PHLCEN_2v11648 [Hermanssonia centrifuga]
MAGTLKLEALIAKASAQHAKLLGYEVRWRDRQRFLESKGYMLRPRYRPGWVPSWFMDKSRPLEEFEDYWDLPVSLCFGVSCVGLQSILKFREHLIDTTRLSDGKMVYVKHVQTGDLESTIAMMLSSSELLKDPRNHCVPILDYFQDEDNATISYMVMPFLHLTDSPPFKTVENIVDFIEQTIEGLVFIHEHGVAHRDCSEKNLMMDVHQLYPEGFHPVLEEFSPDGRTSARQLSRTNVRVKYYYVDFGISVYFPAHQHPKLAVGEYGRDQDVPELSVEVPYDPFKVDIFIIGNMYKRQLYNVRVLFYDKRRY